MGPGSYGRGPLMGLSPYGPGPYGPRPLWAQALMGPGPYRHPYRGRQRLVHLVPMTVRRTTGPNPCNCQCDPWLSHGVRPTTMPVPNICTKSYSRVQVFSFALHLVHLTIQELASDNIRRGCATIVSRPTKPELQNYSSRKACTLEGESKAREGQSNLLCKNARS